GLRWAAHAARWFPDGQLYMSLGGFDSRDSPLDPAEVLARFLLGLGVAAEDVPADLADRAVLYRSLLAKRRVLVLLDDAHTSDQVRPLLPGDGLSMVVVTSRRKLSGLVADGARLLVVHTLPVDAAERLIEHAAGPAADARERALRSTLARLCGYLPLALRIVGARLAVSPRWSIGDLVAELADERTRLAALDIEDADTSVRAALDVTHRSLNEAQARTVGLLAIFPGQWVNPHVVAALCGTDVTRARALLHALAESFLVIETDRDVFGMHDLVRLHARELVTDSVVPLREVARYYVLVADLCRRHIGVVVDDLDAAVEWPYLPRPDIQGREEALDWFESEWSNLLAVAAAAAEAGCHAEVWRLARIAVEFRRVRSRRDDWEWLLALGLESARLAGDLRGQVWLHLSRCVLLTRFGEEHESVADAELAMAVADESRDPRLMAMARNTLAGAEYGCKNYQEALDGYHKALVLARRADYRLGVANALNNIAQVHRNLDNRAEAVGPQRESVVLFRQVGEPRFVSLALANLAELEHELGQLGDAATHAGEAVRIAVENGLELTEAFGREVTGRILRDTGDVEGARAELRVALTLYERVYSPAVDVVRETLATLA
ncbi:MAG: tetratricopeptide repeat protein, partial [Actinomycetota bacterium]|nr:tetratricopeptide repeat protein [Actinomycetota bacterium]